MAGLDPDRVYRASRRWWGRARQSQNLTARFARMQNDHETMSNDSIRHDFPRGIPQRDIAGWIILAWVVVWSAAYFQTALLHRFPRLLGWVERLY